MKARHKWLLIVADIVHWELTCDPGELLSEEADKWVLAHPILAPIAIMAAANLIGLHLSNLINPRFDPISPSFILWRRITRKN